MKRDLSAAPAALNLLESTTPADREQAAALLREVSPAALGREAPGHIIGITGPPGAGKSTLLSALLRCLAGRAGRTVAMLAVDPSSRRSGGSLLGDRARIDFDPADSGVFIRSTAAGERLGGLAWGTRAAAQALAAAFDIVVIETVGVGQAETEVADVADTVAVIVQPGSGDVLQFLKSGIMEIPDVLVVTKADLGQVATSAQARPERRAALARARARRRWWRSPRCRRPVASRSWQRPSRSTALSLDLPQRRLHARRAGALSDFANEHGERGMRALGGRAAAPRAGSPSRTPSWTRGRWWIFWRGGLAGDRQTSCERLVGEVVASMTRDLLTMLGAFVLASALAGALGAANLGTALAFGQIGFAISLVYVMVKR